MSPFIPPITLSSAPWSNFRPVKHRNMSNGGLAHCETARESTHKEGEKEKDRRTLLSANLLNARQNHLCHGPPGYGSKLPEVYVRERNSLELDCLTVVPQTLHLRRLVTHMDLERERTHVLHTSALCLLHSPSPMHGRSSLLTLSVSLSLNSDDCSI